MLKFLRPYRTAVILAPLLMTTEVVMDLIQPRLLERIVDTGITGGNFPVIIQTGLLMIGLAAVGLAGGLGCTVFAVRASQSMGADLRETLFRKIQDFSFANLDRLKTGRLVTRLTNDVVQIQTVVMLTLRIMIRAPLLLVGSVLMAIITSPRLSLILVAIIPLISLVIITVIRRGFKNFIAVQDGLDNVNGTVQENLAGVRLVKSFVRSAYEKTRFAKANDDLMGKTIRAMRLMATIMPLNIFILNMGIVAVLWLGGTGEWDGIITVGQIVAFINYLQRILFSLMMVGMLLTRISRSLVSAERVTEILDEKPAVSFPDLPSGGKASAVSADVRGRLEYRNVTFAYNGAPVLKNISFTVNPGETVAVMGATGSGKTSLVLLIPRFYDVTSGEILLDGRDLREYSEEEIRSRIIIVQQETLLFSGTIGDNIRYGKPEASLEEVKRAARTAQIAEFIERLPRGYDTPIGQRGVGLSGGQKQRVAIARALLTRPSVLILDDCTSAVDMETENEIRNSLREYSTGLTTLIVAQRLSSVYRADRIIILENGDAAAQGNHEELLKTSTVYQEIFRSQLGKWGAENAE